MQPTAALEAALATRQPTRPHWLNARWLRLLLAVAVATPCFVLSAPQGLPAAGWRLAGIFVGTVAAIMTSALPEPTAVLVGVAVAIVAGAPAKEVLSGYADQTFWVIIAAVMMSIAFRKSGLAARIGLLLLRAFGRTPVGLAYVLGTLDLLLATSIPAAPARTGGLVYPLARGVLQATEAHDPQGSRRLGRYLTVSLYMISMLTGSMFLTGMAPNVLNASLAAKLLGIQVTWPMWALAAAPGLLLLLALPFLVVRLAPPGELSLAAARERAGADLAALGSLRRVEWIAGAVFLAALALWATGPLTKIGLTSVALGGVAVLLLTETIKWEDLAESRETWSAFIWFGGILGLATALDASGFFTWLIGGLRGALPTGLGVGTSLLLVALLATLPHYLFPSLVGYVATFSPVVFSFIAATGLPRYPAALLAMFLMTISSTLTHYGNGVGPILFGAGYVSKATWWKTGLAVTALAAGIYLGVGVPYWKLVGLFH